MSFMYIQLLVSFFLFPCGFPGENRAKLKKLFHLDSRLRWEAQYPRYNENTYYFLISNCSNAWIDASDFLK